VHKPDVFWRTPGIWIVDTCCEQEILSRNTSIEEQPGQSQHEGRSWVGGMDRRPGCEQFEYISDVLLESGGLEPDAEVKNPGELYRFVLGQISVKS
jgi:hypothetical protein